MSMGGAVNMQTFSYCVSSALGMVTSCAQKLNYIRKEVITLGEHFFIIVSASELC